MRDGDQLSHPTKSRSRTYNGLSKNWLSFPLLEVQKLSSQCNYIIIQTYLIWFHKSYFTRYFEFHQITFEIIKNQYLINNNKNLKTIKLNSIVIRYRNFYTRESNFIDDGVIDTTYIIVELTTGRTTFNSKIILLDEDGLF